MTYRWVRLSVANLVLQIYFRMSPVLLPFNIKLKPLESRHNFQWFLLPMPIALCVFVKYLYLQRYQGFRFLLFREPRMYLFSTELVKQRFSVTKLLSLEDSGSV